MTWNDLDWTALDRLRAKFLHGSAADGPYWETPTDLACYDFTYGERIGWKWDQVLRELRLRRWNPCEVRSAATPGAPSGQPAGLRVLDWGCGSGIAARRVLAFFGAGNFRTLAVWDHSPLACAYAAETARQAFPGLDVAEATPGFLDGDERLDLLIVSHVLNELSPEALASLRRVMARAGSVLWVEPGTHAVSRQLGALREEVRSEFRVVAPCTHPGACSIFAAGHERDWCHFFAPPPPEIFADSHWVKFGQRAGIDLRSLPYCFLALDRAGPTSEAADLSRVIGRVEHFKPYARLLNCDASGLAELQLPKRADPALFKQLERTKAPLVYRWVREGDTLRGGAPLEAGVNPNPCTGQEPARR